MVNERDVWTKKIDSVLQDWSQGDCVLGEYFFVHRFNPKSPLTPDSASVVQQKIDFIGSEDKKSLILEHVCDVMRTWLFHRINFQTSLTPDYASLEQEEPDIVESEVKGFTIVTQTCDIVRACDERPFIEVSPLIEVNDQFLKKFDFKRTKENFLDEIQKGKRPHFAYIEGIAELHLIVDLDRVMTVEKSVVSDWHRIKGCKNDQEARAFGKALARKRMRFAFPDDFTELAKKLRNRMGEKHDKNSNEGEALRSLLEIRIRAEPSWDAEEVNLMFWFIRDEEQNNFKGVEWHKFRTQWLGLIPESGRFKNIEASVVALEDMTAKEYIESDQLDLEHLSSA